MSLVIALIGQLNVHVLFRTTLNQTITLDKVLIYTTLCYIDST